MEEEALASTGPELECVFEIVSAIRLRCEGQKRTRYGTDPVELCEQARSALHNALPACRDAEAACRCLPVEGDDVETEQALCGAVTNPERLEDRAVDERCPTGETLHTVAVCHCGDVIDEKFVTKNYTTYHQVVSTGGQCRTAFAACRARCISDGHGNGASLKACDDVCL